MPNAQLRIADEFAYALSNIYSKRVLAQIRKLIELLAENPEMGSADVRDSLTKLYGSNLRKLAVSKFLIIYRYDDQFVDVIALVYGPTVI